MFFIPFQRFHKCVLAGLLVLSLHENALSCGLIWSVPRNHFDGVNEYGDVSWWKQIGRIDLGSNVDGTPLTWPLIVNFKPSRESSSPWLGKSWMVPLFESQFIALDEKRWLMIEPDGHNRYFSKIKTKSLGAVLGRTDAEAMLESGGGWLAEMKGDVVNVWAECGWKLRYVSGRLQQICTPQGRQLEIVRNRGVAVGISESGKIKVSTVFNGFAGELSEIVLPTGERIAVTQGLRPRRKVPDGNKEIRYDRSLSSIQSTKGVDVAFEYSLNRSGDPTILIGEASEKRSISWDAATGRIITENEWEYTITPSKEDGEYAKIERKKGKVSQYWFNNYKVGVEISQNCADIKIVSLRFVSGKLKGKLKRIEKTEKGKTSVVLEIAYDESGRAIREARLNEVLYLKYDEHGRLVEKVDESGSCQWRRAYDERNRITLDERPGVKKETRVYSEGGGYVKTVFDKLSGFHANARPTIVKEYDSRGYNIAVWDEMGVKSDYIRDSDNRVEAVFYGSKLRQRILFDAVGREAMEVNFLPQTSKLFYVKKYLYGEKGPSGKRSIQFFKPNELKQEEREEIVSESQSYSLRKINRALE